MDFVIYGHSSSQTTLARGSCNFESFENIPVPIYHEIHTGSYNFFLHKHALTVVSPQSSISECVE